MACLLLVVTPGLAPAPAPPRRLRAPRVQGRGHPAQRPAPSRSASALCGGRQPREYLDGMILTAALLPCFSFVIKREVASVPFLHLLLRRIGSQFVERFDRHRSGSTLGAPSRGTPRGEALAFFPEGTFRRYPGSGAFTRGAFTDSRARRAARRSHRYPRLA